MSSILILLADNDNNDDDDDDDDDDRDDNVKLNDLLNMYDARDNIINNFHAATIIF